MALQQQQECPDLPSTLHNVSICHNSLPANCNRPSRPEEVREGRNVVVAHSHRTLLCTCLILAGILTVGGLSAGSDLQTGYWSVSDHADFLYYGFQEIYKLTRRLHCANMCLETPYCTAFAYAKKMGFCYIYVHKEHDAGANGSARVGVRHYRKRIVDCPIIAGYTQTHNEEVCLKIYSIVANYKQAKHHCERDSGHLYFMDSDFKKDVLKDHFKNSGAATGDYFVGAVTNVVGGVANFRWLNGRKVNSSAWNPQTEFNTSKSCVVVQSDHFLLGVTSCSNSAMFVCEVS